MGKGSKILSFIKYSLFKYYKYENYSSVLSLQCQEYPCNRSGLSSR